MSRSRGQAQGNPGLHHGCGSRARPWVSCPTKEPCPSAHLQGAPPILRCPPWMPSSRVPFQMPCQCGLPRGALSLGTPSSQLPTSPLGAPPLHLPSKTPSHSHTHTHTTVPFSQTPECSPSPVENDVIERASLDVEKVGVDRAYHRRGRIRRRTRKRQLIGQQSQEERGRVRPAHAHEGALSQLEAGPGCAACRVAALTARAVGQAVPWGRAQLPAPGRAATPWSCAPEKCRGRHLTHE